MRFKGLDLNLLAALDVLLDERNVSRAAERLHLTQPAISAALARLRDYFGDPILAPHGKRMIPTARALALRPLLKQVLAQVDTMVAQSTCFDPATSDRCFAIGVSDYLVAVLFPAIIPALRIEAPGVRLDLRAPSEEVQLALDKGEIDLILTPAEHCVPDHPTELLFEERHVVAGCASNPLLARPIGEDDFYAARHVAVRIGKVTRASFGETHLRARGRERRIEIQASSFTSVPQLLIGTDRLAVMHERLARAMAQRFAIAWQELPFDFPAMPEMLQYNRTRANDAGLRWMIERLHEAALIS